MSLQFRKDADYGEHEAIPLASCALGVPSRESMRAFLDFRDARTHLCSEEFDRHEIFGTQATISLARSFIARILNTSAENISLISGTTEGISIVRRGLTLSAGANVLLYSAEFRDPFFPFTYFAGEFYQCNPIFIRGARDERMRPLGFDLAEVEEKLSGCDIKLCMISHVQTSNGFATDVNALRSICSRYEVPLILDASQSFGVIPINLDELKIDALVAPMWRWIGGCHGLGFLYTSPDFRTRLKCEDISSSAYERRHWLLDLEKSPLVSDGRRFETSTLPASEWFATNPQLRLVGDLGSISVANETSRLCRLAKELLATPRLKLFEPPFDSRPGSFLAFTLQDQFYGREQEIRERLFNHPQRIDITVSTGFIRVAPPHFVSEESLRIACKAIRDVVEEL